MSGRDHRHTALILILLAIGTAVRFAFLGAESLWEDEIGSLIIARMPIGDILRMHQTTIEFHPPLYFAALHYWVSLFGETEFAVRSMSAVFSTCSLYLMYAVGRDLFGREAGLTAMGLLAFSTFHVRFAQEARNYALTVLLGLASFHYLIRCMKNFSFPSGAGYAVSTAALLYTNNLGLLIPFAQNLLVFSGGAFTEPREKRRWLLSQFAILVLFAPWLPIFVSQLVSAQKGFWISPPDIQTLLDTLLEYGGGLTSCHASRDYDISASIVTTFLLLISGLVSMFDVSHTSAPDAGPTEGWILRRFHAPAMTMTFLWLAIPLLVPYFLSFVGQPVFITRVTILSSIALYILAARGVAVIPSMRVKHLLLGAFTLLMVLSLKEYYLSPDKDQWREAAAIVADDAQPDDTIVVASARCKESFGYYFRQAMQRILPFPVSSPEINDKTVSELMPQLEHSGRIWLLLSYHTFGDANLLLAKLAGRYRLLRHREVFGIQLYLLGRT